MCSRRAAARLNCTGGGAADTDVDIAHITSEWIVLRFLHERSAAVVGSGNMAAACLPRDVHRSIRTIYCDRRLGGICLRRGRNLSGKANDILRPRRWSSQQERSQAEKNAPNRYPKTNPVRVSVEGSARKHHPSSHHRRPLCDSLSTKTAFLCPEGAIRKTS